MPDNRNVPELNPENFEFLMTLVNNAHGISIFALDQQFQYVIFNKTHKRQMKRLYGVNIKSGMNMLEQIADKDMRLQARDRFERVLNGEHIVEIEKMADKAIWLETDLTPLKSKSGNIIGISAIARDVTKQRKTEIELKKQSERSRQILHTTMDGFILADEQGQIIDVNHSYCKMIGYSRSALLKMNIRQLEVKIPQEEIDRRIQKMISKGFDRFETRHRRKDGKIVDLEVSIVIMPSDGKPFVAAFLRDVTDRKQAELELLSFFEYAAIPIWVEDFSNVKSGLDQLKSKGVSDIRNYFDTNPDEIKRFSAMIKVLNVNQKSVEFYGKKNKSDLPRNLAEYMIEESWSVMKEELICLSAGQTSFESVIPIHSPDKTLKQLIIKLEVAPGYEESLARVFVSFIDITDRVKAEKALSANEQKLNNAVRIAKLGYWEWDIPSDKVTWSDKIYEIYDLDPGTEIKYETVMSRIHPEDREYHDRVTKEWMEKGGGPPYEYRIVRRDGSIRYVIAHGEVIKNAKNEAIKFTGIVRDITEQKVAQLALIDSEEKYKNLFENNVVAVALSDLQGNLHSINREMKRLFGIAQADLNGVNIKNFYANPEDRQGFLEQLKKHGRVSNMEMRMKNLQGEPFWTNFSSALVEYQGKNMLISTAINIDKQKTAQEALVQSEARYHTLFENSPVALCEQDSSELMAYFDYLQTEKIKSESLPKYLEANLDELMTCAEKLKVIDVNQAALKLHQAKSKKELIEYFNGKLLKYSYEAIRESVLTLAAGTRIFESESKVKTLNGETRDIIIRFKVENHSNQKHRILLAMTDITELKMVQQQLNERLRELGLVNELSAKIGQDTTLQSLAKDAIHSIRQAVRPDIIFIFLRNEEELQLLSHYSDLPGFSTEDYQYHRISECLCGLAAGKGEQVYSANIHADLRCTLDECKHAGLHSFAALPLISNDKILGIIGVASSTERDFSQDREVLETLCNEISIGFQNVKLIDELRQHEAELEDRVVKRTAELEMANKELESFSYSVSHDLRAPLRAIEGFSKIIQEEYVKEIDEEGQRLFNIVRGNTIKMGQLIEDLLEFSKISRRSLKYSEIDMSGLVKSMYYELTDDDSRSKISFDCQPLPPVQGDAAMLRQVVLNLISNAIKFSSGNDKPRIEVGCKVENNENVYYIRDNGVGFDMKYADKLFQIFQRLHSSDRFDGTGIGLSIVQRILARHGGRVWAESEVDQGATFYFVI